MTLQEIKQMSHRHSKNKEKYKDCKEPYKRFSTIVMKHYPSLSKDEKLLLLNDVQVDLEKGIYVKHPSVARDLANISDTLYKEIYSDGVTLSISEILILITYGYLE